MSIVTIPATREGTEAGADRTGGEQEVADYEGIADLLFEIKRKPVKMQ